MTFPLLSKIMVFHNQGNRKKEALSSDKGGWVPRDPHNRGKHDLMPNELRVFEESSAVATLANQWALLQEGGSLVPSRTTTTESPSIRTLGRVSGSAT
jgi:hypothetical protein